MRNGTNRTILSIVIIGALATPPAFGWFSSGNAGYGGEYLLSLGGGARSMGVGLAQTALSGQANLLYSNPASIADLWWREASFGFVPLFGQAQFATIAFGYPFGEKQAAGLSLVRLTSAEAEKTNALGETVGTFYDQETAIIFGYARQALPGLQVGADVKVLTQEIDTVAHNGWGIDAGAIYRYNDRHVWGVSFANIVPARLGYDTFPFEPRFGCRHGLFAKDLYASADLALRHILQGAAETRWYTGLEYTWPQWFVWRMGLNGKQVSAGFGVATRQIDLDYACVYHPLDVVHSISLNLRYGFVPEEGETRVKTEWEKLDQEKQEYLAQVRKENEKIRFERERLEKEKRIAKKLMQARSEFEAKRYDASRAILNEVLKEAPADETARALLSEIAARVDTASIGRRLEYAKALYQKGSFREVLEHIHYVLSVQPDNAGALVLGYLAQAQVYVGEKKYHDAKGELIEVLKMEPANAEATQLIKRIQTILDVYGEQ